MKHGAPLKPIVLAAFCLGVLVALQTSVIFDQGWSFTGIPHGYLNSALQVYEGRDVAIGVGDDPFLATEMDNLALSPLYRISTLLGRIGAPTPPWFRLTGVVLLIAIFAAAWFTVDRKRPPVDRLLAAVAVSTTPAVLHVTRRLEDHGLYILVLVVAAALARKALDRPRPTWDIALYLLPASLFLFGHMYTYQAIAGLHLACILAYYGVRRIAGGGRSEWREEIPRWLFAGSMVVLAIALRSEWHNLRGMVDYYLRESGNPSGPGSAFTATAWDHAIAYPQLMVWAMAGPVLCALALANLRPKWRAPNAGMLAAWAIVPLALLTLVSKKELMYGFYAAPAIALLACGPLYRLPHWAKIAAVLSLLAAAAMLGANPFPLVPRVDSKALYDGAVELPEEELRADAEEIRTDAREILATAERCGPLDGQAILVLPRGLSKHRLRPLNFALLSLDRRPRYLLPLLLANRPYGSTTIVDCGRGANDPAFGVLSPYDTPELYALIDLDERPWLAWRDCRLYCPVR